MDAIVSLFDEQDGRRLRLLWDELQDRFGLTSGFATRFPHFSYLSAESIDHDRIAPLLEPIAGEIEELTVTTSGLGFFPGPTPVIHLPVIRTARLSEIHQRIWTACSAVTADPREQFAPDNWIPHITLALDGLSDTDPMQVLSWLATREFDWSIRVDNIGIITSEGEQRRFTFAPGRRLESQPTA